MSCAGFSKFSWTQSLQYMCILESISTGTHFKAYTFDLPEVKYCVKLILSETNRTKINREEKCQVDWHDVTTYPDHLLLPLSSYQNRGGDIDELVISYNTQYYINVSKSITCLYQCHGAVTSASNTQGLICNRNAIQVWKKPSNSYASWKFAMTITCSQASNLSSPYIQEHDPYTTPLSLTAFLQSSSPFKWGGNTYSVGTFSPWQNFQSYNWQSSMESNWLHVGWRPSWELQKWRIKGVEVRIKCWILFTAIQISQRKPSDHFTRCCNLCLHLSLTKRSMLMS